MKNTNLLFFITILIFLMLGLYDTYVPIINSGIQPGFSISSLVYIIILLTIDIMSILFFLNFITRQNIKIDNWFHVLFLPSIFTALFSLILDVAPFFWSLYDPDALFSLAIYQYMEDSILLTLVAKSCLIIGIIFSRQKQYTMYGNIDILKDLKIDSFKDWVINNIPLLYLVTLAVLVGLAGIGFDLSHNRSKALDPEAVVLPGNVLGVISFFIVIFVGIFYSRKSGFMPWVAVLFPSLPIALSFSRGPLMYLLFYIISSSLMGKKYPKILYNLLLVALPMGTIVGFYFRGGAEGALDLSLKNFGDSILMTNTNLGLLTNSLAFRDESSPFLENLWAIITSLLPLPTDIFPYHTEHIAELRGIADIIGIPMPTIGTIYFKLGWFGVLVMLFIAGWLMGRLEAKILFHGKQFGQVCWHHVFLLIAWLIVQIWAYHTGLRACTRVLVYGSILIWLASKSGMVSAPKDFNFDRIK